MPSKKICKSPQQHTELLTIVEHDYASPSLNYLENILPQNNCSVLYYEALNCSLDLLWHRLLNNFMPYYPDLIHKLLTLGFPRDSLELVHTFTLISQLKWSKKTVIVINNAHVLFKENPDLINFFLSFLANNLPNLYIVLFINKNSPQLTLQQLKTQTKTIIIQPLIKDSSHRTMPYAPLIGDLTSLEKHFCLGLCQLEYFSIKQVSYLTARGSPEKLLHKFLQLEFLIYNKYTDTYAFYPNIQQQLRDKFATLPSAVQKGIFFNLAKYSAMQKNYPVATHFYFLARAPKEIRTLLSLASKNNFFAFSLSALNSYFEYLTLFFSSELLYLRLTYIRYLVAHLPLTELDKLLFSLEVDIKTLTNLTIRRKLWAELLVLKIFLYFPNILPRKKDLFKLKYLQQQQLNILTFFNNWGFPTPELIVWLDYPPTTFLNSLNSLQNCFNYYNNFTNNYFSGINYLLQAEQEYYANSLLESVAHAYKALDLAILANNTYLQLTAYFLISKIAIAKGDNPHFSLAWTKIIALKTTNSNPNLEHALALSEIIIHSLLSSENKSLDSWLENLETSSFFISPAIKPYLLNQYLCYLLKSANFSKLVSTYKTHEVLLETSTSLILKIYNYLFLAIAYNNYAEFSLATTYYKKSLALAMPANIIMPFVENYHLIKPLIDNLKLENQSDLALDAFHKKLITSYQASANKISIPQTTTSIISLTAREKEIAYLTASGLTNAAISKQLYIAEITVKKALQNIFRKLNVHNRLSLALLLKKIHHSS